MKDKKKIVFVSGLVIFLAVFVVICGSYIVSIFAADNIPYGVYLGELNLSEITLKDANYRIDDFYPDYIRKRSVTLSVEGNTYIIPMERIGVRLDKQASINEILGKTKKERVYSTIRGIFEKKERKIEPIFDCDEKLLTSNINKIKSEIDRNPLDATIKMKNEKIEKKREIYGLQLGVENTVNTIKNELKKGNIGPINLKSGANADFRLVKPDATMADIDEISDIIGKGMTYIEDEDLLNSIKETTKAINGIFIPKRQLKDNINQSEFSFFKWLEKEKFKLTKYNPGVNQVASTLYVAVIKAGVSGKDIDIIADLDGNKYSPDIKRIKVMGTITDFKFRNNTTSPMVIKSQVEEGSVVVYLLGKKEVIK